LEEEGGGDLWAGFLVSIVYRLVVWERVVAGAQFSDEVIFLFAFLFEVVFDLVLLSE
jgi:hypothetical protein